MKKEKLTFGQKVSDFVVNVMGSWTFVITQTIILTIWMGLNITAFVQHWDPYPFICLNLALSMQAAYAAPLVLMSSKRSEQKQQQMTEKDLKTDIDSETKIDRILQILEKK